MSTTTRARQFAYRFIQFKEDGSNWEEILAWADVNSLPANGSTSEITLDSICNNCVAKPGDWLVDTADKVFALHPSSFKSFMEHAEEYLQTLTYNPLANTTLKDVCQEIIDSRQ